MHPAEALAVYVVILIFCLLQAWLSSWAYGLL